MGKYCSWIEYKGVRILFANFAGIKDETEYIRGFDELEQAMLSAPKGNIIPCLTDISNSMLSQAVNERSRKMTANVKAAGYPDSPTAMVGASGLQKAVISAIGVFRRDIQNFDNLPAAKEWLVQQVKK